MFFPKPNRVWFGPNRYAFGLDGFSMRGVGGWPNTPCFVTFFCIKVMDLLVKNEQQGGRRFSIPKIHKNSINKQLFCRSSLSCTYQSNLLIKRQDLCSSCCPWDADSRNGPGRWQPPRRGRWCWRTTPQQAGTGGPIICHLLSVTIYPMLNNHGSFITR